MDELTPEQADLEERLTALANGDLPPDEAREVLALVARDEGASRLLGEILAVQGAARRAYGYDIDESTIASSRTRLLESLAAPPAQDESVPSPDAPLAINPRRAAAARLRKGDAPLHQGKARLLPRMRRALPYAAAAAVVAVSLGLALTAHLDKRRAELQLAEVRASSAMPAPGESAALPAISEAQRREYRRIWTEVADSPGGPQPWVALSDGGGQFGYLPVSTEQGPSERLLLVRCIVLSAASEQVECVTLLVPARQGLRLALPDVGRLLGRPVACEIATGNRQASVSLTVGSDSPDAVGVSGRVNFGERSVEIGRFTVNGGPLRVIVQVVPLDGTVG